VCTGNARQFDIADRPGVPVDGIKVSRVTAFDAVAFGFPSQQPTDERFFGAKFNDLPRCFNSNRIEVEVTLENKPKVAYLRDFSLVGSRVLRLSSSRHRYLPS